jgi:hypothetical protein
MNPLIPPQRFGLNVSTPNSVPIDSIVFYKPPLAAIPDFNSKPVRSFPTIPRNNGGIGPAPLQSNKENKS